MATCAGNTEDWNLAHSNEQGTIEHLISVQESLINSWFDVGTT